MGSNKHVNNVEKITTVVQNDPTKRKTVLEFPETRSTNDKDEIVHDSNVDHHQPFVIIILARVKSKISTNSPIEI